MTDLRAAIAQFTEYMVRNYPSQTIISDPAWHAPRLFRAAQQALAVAERAAEPLTFDAFRAANVARCIKWHPQGIASWSPSDWLTAVTGELGELASLLKMRNRERDGLPGNKFSPTDKQVADELADVLTYLDLLAEVLGINLGAAAVIKFNEVSERVGFPDRIALYARPPLAAPASEPQTTTEQAWDEIAQARYGQAPAEPPADALVERLRDAGAGEESGSHTHRAIFDAIDRIAALTAERDEQHRLAVKRWDDMCAYADRTTAAESALAAATEREEGLRRALAELVACYVLDASGDFRPLEQRLHAWEAVKALAAKGGPDA